MADLDSVLACLDLNLDRSVDRLFDLLRIPSISTDPAYAADCRRAAEWLTGDLSAIGFEASRLHRVHVLVQPISDYGLVLRCQHQRVHPAHTHGFGSESFDIGFIACTRVSSA